MLTDDDKKFLKESFVSKDYLDNALDNKLDNALKPIHKRLDRISKKLDLTVKMFDTITSKQHKRIERVENHLGLPCFVD